MYLKLDGYEINVREGASWLEALALLPDEKKASAPLGISVLGRT